MSERLFFGARGELPFERDLDAIVSSESNFRFDDNGINFTTGAEQAVRRGNWLKPKGLGKVRAENGPIGACVHKKSRFVRRSVAC